MLIIKMRIRSGNTVPIHYRRMVTSFIKEACKNVNIEYFKKNYTLGNTVKRWCSSVNLFKAVFHEAEITVFGKEFDICIQGESFDEHIIKDCFNGFNTFQYKGQIFDCISTKIFETRYVDTPYHFASEYIKTKSPIVFIDGGKYITIDDGDEYMNECLNRVMQTIFDQLKIDEKSDLKLCPISANKAIIKVDGGYVFGSSGVFSLSGPKEQVNHALKLGIGNKRSFGYGHIELKKEAKQ